MDPTQQRNEATVEMQGVHRPGEAEARSCFECRHVTGRGGFPYCRFHDKPTSGAVNGCTEFQRHG